LASFQEIIKGEIPVLIDFHADWCEPCKTMQPTLKDIKDEFGSNLKILKINVDNNSAISEKFNIVGIPTFMLFSKGVVKWRKSGIITTSEFVSIMKDQI
jgi:thioredoxin 1